MIRKRIEYLYRVLININYGWQNNKSLKKIYLLFACSLLILSLQAQTFSSVQQIANRRVPWLSKHLEFKIIPKQNGEDAYELSSQNNKIVIAATNANAAAVALNFYLTRYCHRSMSHLGDNLSPLKKIPQIKTTVKNVSPFQYRYALNYCTINYTMSFYTWKDWERELDWLALHGFNLVLMPVGVEKIWQNTLKQFDYSDKEIKEFIPGAAFTAWWLMGNLEGWGGAVSQTIIDQQALLAKKIIARMKELNIQPVIQSFYGMIPTSLKNKFPDAAIIPQGNWAGGFTRPDILLPNDILYKKMAAVYYNEIKTLYGSDIHFFCGEPFHEGGKADGINVSEATNLVQQQMQQHFPKSTWVLQGWQNNPSKDFLRNLDKEHTLIIELFGENTRNWEQRKGYENTNFIWSNVSNFGEKNGLYGKLQRFANEIYYAKKSSYSSLLKGIGIIPEGINNNPVAYDFMAHLAWTKDSVDAKQWIRNYVHYRYGFTNDTLQKAWDLLLQTVYSSPDEKQEGSPESIFCARPALNITGVSTWGTRKRNYNLQLFEDAVKLFVQAGKNISSSTYNIDKIDFVRQLQANKADEVYQQMCDAVTQKNKASFLQAYDLFEKMLLQQDLLLSSSKYFSLNTWLLQSQKFVKNSADKKMALLNAKTQITYWGSNNSQTDLHDYAHKEWAGLLSSLYLQRWQLFKKEMLAKINGENFIADYFEIEKKWAETDSFYSVNPTLEDDLSNLIERIIEN
ncbi:MAG: alpha-N-acetylglucosaminidase [Chitinophagaceae bacterium]|nr:alpha-N-acetylglucosaminidase [Chitinophagaceae bacterium]